VISALARAQFGTRRTWLRFTDPTDVIIADRLSEVQPALQRVEAAVDNGCWAVGLVSYDAGPAFDPAIRSHRDATVPLVHFGLFQPRSVIESAPAGSGYWLGPRQPLISRSNFEEGVRSVHRFIEAGDTYQVNLTLRLGARFTGDPEGLFARMAEAQMGEHQVLLDLGENAVCSASPELFLIRKQNGSLRSKPMKGTRPAGTDPAELRASEKDRAENTMIVDMMRNDFGRIADVGSVRVPELHAIEEYPTVLQMVSTVTATTSANLTEIFQATFPPASITGAPKIRTTEIITELETQPRGVYTGSIGVLSPAGSPSGRRDEWNVAIRTVWIDRDAGRATYGVGGGIVWDSNPRGEWDETRVKSRVLLSADQDLSLIESFRYDPHDPTLSADFGLWLLREHLDRLERSADFFQFKSDPEEILAQLAQFTSEEACKLRVLLSSEGQLNLVAQQIGPTGWFGLDPPERSSATLTVPLVIDSVPVRVDDPFLRHKTTIRTTYERARARHPDADDVILVDADEHVTESLRANVVVRNSDGFLVTPPTTAGLLPGVFRQHLLDVARMIEEPVSIGEIRRAVTEERAWLINGVRGWMTLIP
jgi:para-aminobenzoate synthetase/4-amino-4-deoxychorismate lyase